MSAKKVFFFVEKMSFQKGHRGASETKMFEVAIAPSPQFFFGKQKFDVLFIFCLAGLNSAKCRVLFFEGRSKRTLVSTTRAEM